MVAQEIRSGEWRKQGGALGDFIAHLGRALRVLLYCDVKLTGPLTLCVNILQKE